MTTAFSLKRKRHDLLLDMYVKIVWFVTTDEIVSALVRIVE